MKIVDIFERMRFFVLFFLLKIPIALLSQTFEIKEQSISICYIEDYTRLGVTGTIKIEEEIDNILIEAYFDTNYEFTSPCDSVEIVGYTPNSVKINNDIVNLGNQLNGTDIIKYSIGRFFYSRLDNNKYFIFEMSNALQSKIDVSYCYVIIHANENNRKGKHILYEKDSNPISKPELNKLLASLHKTKRNSHLSE